MTTIVDFMPFEHTSLSNKTQPGIPIFDNFMQLLGSYSNNNAENVYFQVV